MTHTQRGFTIIELTITVAIIGILAGIALPMYRDYIGRAEAASALGTLVGLRTGVEQGLVSGKDSLTLADIGGSANASYLGTIALAYSRDPASLSTLQITFGASSPATAGKYIQLYRNNSDPRWYCSTSLNSTYRPKNCS